VFRSRIAHDNVVGTPPSVEAEIAALAARQHGRVTIGQLLAVGLDRPGVSRRVARGLLHREGRGVYAVGHAGRSREGEFMAAVLGAGTGAALGLLAATELHAVRRYRAPLIDVVAPRWRRAQPGVRIHRVRALHRRDVTEVRGIPVTSIPRTLVDLSDVLDAYELANVIHEAAFRGKFSLLATQDAMARANGRHNLAVLEHALTLHVAGSAGIKSGPEKAFLSLLDGLPTPLVNTHLHGVEVDFHWPELKLAVEIDGPGHGRPRTQREDALKQQILEAAGYTVVRFTEMDVELERLRLPEPLSGRDGRAATRGRRARR
jgi:hypothetical protein